MLLCNFLLQSRKNVTKFFSYLNSYYASVGRLTDRDRNRMLDPNKLGDVKSHARMRKLPVYLHMIARATLICNWLTFFFFFLICIYVLVLSLISLLSKTKMFSINFHPEFKYADIMNVMKFSTKI